MTDVHTPASGREYRRLVLSFHDIDEAVRLAYALQRSIEQPVPLPADRRLLRQAMSAAFLVAYMRPFKRSRFDDETERLVRVENISNLTGAQRDLHTRLERLRDTIVAHADPQPRQLRVHDDPDFGRMPISNNVDIAFAPEAAVELKDLADAVRTWIDGRLAGVMIATHLQE